ncbi:hypothetical protein HPB47_011527 [Ixodes persulcatus]|uniref:Uncharacterized protein n=1 Tax=Ixodes persulcatus TaxID=34615 RepID=A0AC60NW24_IXOPE|nr:hypothetical protein HPB47_011527 [Ixodes persulcatus]
MSWSSSRVESPRSVVLRESTDPQILRFCDRRRSRRNQPPAAPPERQTYGQSAVGSYDSPVVNWRPKDADEIDPGPPDRHAAKAETYIKAATRWLSGLFGKYEKEASNLTGS